MECRRRMDEEIKITWNGRDIGQWRRGSLLTVFYLPEHAKESSSGGFFCLETDLMLITKRKRDRILLFIRSIKLEAGADPGGESVRQRAWSGRILSSSLFGERHLAFVMRYVNDYVFT